MALASPGVGKNMNETEKDILKDTQLDEKTEIELSSLLISTPQQIKFKCEECLNVTLCTDFKQVMVTSRNQVHFLDSS